MTQFALWGTIVNTAAVAVGALFGLLLRFITARAAKKDTVEKGNDPAVQRPPRLATLSDTVQKGVGLCVILIGILGAVKVQNILVLILSVVLGAAVGELLDLHGLLEKLGARIERGVKGRMGNVAEGFVAATMLFCVGAMTLTGAMESGLFHQHSTYYAKSILDMTSACVFAFSMGTGVLFSALGVFAVQGLLTLLAMLAGGAISAAVTGEMMAVGSLLVLAIGTNLLGVTKLKVTNYLPAMLCPLFLCPLFELIF